MTEQQPSPAARPEVAAGSAVPGSAVPGSAVPGSAVPESEPDPRFTLANERTFLAWSRTALALVAAGLGIVQLLPPFKGVPLGRHVVGVPLIILGAVLAIAAYWEMTRNQLALRQGAPLPRSVLPRLLAGTIAGVAAIAAVVVLLSASR
jgi:inner membrane protein YidH